jgi:hypothetical protein
VRKEFFWRACLLSQRITVVRAVPCCLVDIMTMDDNRKQLNDVCLLSQDTVTGFVLAGVGHRTVEGQNFLVVKSGGHCLFFISVFPVSDHDFVGL